MSKQQQQPQQAAAKPKAKKRSGSYSPRGVAHIQASFNNTIVTITDEAGHVISWSSPGKVNFSGSRKSAAFAATVAAQDAGKIARDRGVQELRVEIKGPGTGRESAVRGLKSTGLEITEIKDVTPVPHNGCRARKRRRV